MNGSDESIVRRFALQNAVFYNGKANPQAVIGKIMGACPDLRSRSGEITPLVFEIVREVNALSPEMQSNMLRDLDPSMMEREVRTYSHDLPDLEGVDGKVVMRIAPGPSGPLHIGHTRASMLNDEYVKRYGGELVLRFEDTNPERIEPTAYETIPEDLEWLGVKVDRTYIQSDRFEKYYDCTKRLIEAGHAYVCLCDNDEWRKLKEAETACPCRDLPPEEQLDRYDRFMSGEFGPGEAAVVVKTDLHHPNPAVRDFVALRIVGTEHPRTGDRYIAYPMMNLAVAVDDHDMGMTHVIRGKDHLNNTLRQEYVFDYFGWRKPVYYHYGLVHIEDTILKTSLIGKSIKAGDLTGWDDVRTGTVRALKRRGIRAEAIRNYWKEMGIKPVDIGFSWNGLYSKNREIIDPKANRYFFVDDPVAVEVSGTGTVSGRAPLHPDHPERGYREYGLELPSTVFISSEDAAQFRENGMVRLKDLCNIRYGVPAEPAGNDLSVLRNGVKAVQWTEDGSPEAELLMPDGNVRKGYVERKLLSEPGDTVQLERIGYAKVESRSDRGMRLVFTHR